LQVAYIEYLAKKFGVIKRKEEWLAFRRRAEENTNSEEAALLERIMAKVKE